MDKVTRFTVIGIVSAAVIAGLLYLRIGRLKIINESGNPLENVTITFDSEAGRTQKVVTNIAPGASAVIHYTMNSEYYMTVEARDVRGIVRDDYGYVEDWWGIPHHTVEYTEERRIKVDGEGA